MTADLSRYADWIDFLTTLPTHVPSLQVVVVNGSAVTGGWDDHSDLDVDVWCRGPVQTSYDAVLALARQTFAIDHVWELPMAADAIERHCFIHLQPDAADLARPTRLLDIHFLETPERLTVDVRRHGVPLVLHDPEGVLLLEDDDEEDMAAERRRTLENIASRRQTAAWLVVRAVARGDLAEAAMFHLRLAVEPLVALLRIRHCPARHDFGLRYLRTDLPDGMAQQVEALLAGPAGPIDPPMSSPQEVLADRARAAFAWQDEVLSQLGEGRSAERHLTNCGVSGGFHHSPL